MDGPVNHFMGEEGVGGYLYLTKKELVFISHNFNIQVHEATILINGIFEVETTLTLGLIDNGLEIMSKNGVETFVVFNRKNWIEKINHVISYQRKESEVGFALERQGKLGKVIRNTEENGDIVYINQQQFSF